jgi:hypothetical protein
VWAAITNGENAPRSSAGLRDRKSGDASTGLVGLTGRETRMLFGKLAIADKWITEVADGGFYNTRQESGGFIVMLTMCLENNNDGISLTVSHDAIAWLRRNGDVGADEPHVQK